MFCSGCGKAIAAGQGYCPNCGRPVTPIAPPPIPGFGIQLESYSTKIRALGILWFVYAGLSLLVGFAGLAFLRGAFFGGFGPWMMHPMMHGPTPPAWVFGAMLPIVWAYMAIRAALAIAAGWGLMAHAQWGRIVAIIAAIVSLIRFPFGTALGIGTLVILLGYRNSRLYEQL